MQRYDYAIVGGGVYGLCAAYHLAKSGAQIAIFQRFTIGHTDGSSHGPTRIIRQAYFEKCYAQLSREAAQKYWPQMQNTLESKLIYKNDFLYITNSEEDFKKAEEISKSFPSQKVVTSQQLTNKYNNFPLLDKQFKIIHDTASGIITAGKFIERLADYLKKLPNVVIFQNIYVKEIRDNLKYVLLSLQCEQIRANKVIVTAGKWVNELIPQIKQLVTPIKQHYVYLQMNTPLNYKTGRFPSFQYHIKDRGNFYCLPDKYGEGIKFGVQFFEDQHQNQKQMRKNLVEASKTLFDNKIKKINKFDTCFYTMTKSHDFIIDWVNPQTQNTLICSCCSGHGFKFSALLGKVLSDLVISNKSIDLFEKNRHRFRIPFHQGINLQ